MMAAVPSAMGGIQILGTAMFHAQRLVRLWIHGHVSAFEAFGWVSHIWVREGAFVWVLLEECRRSWILLEEDIRNILSYSAT